MRPVTWALALALLCATPAAADPIITATLEDGCFRADDPRLLTATWRITGTFATAAFRDPLAGCDATIFEGMDGWLYDEDRLANTLETRLNPASIPTCGRAQYDAQVWIDGAPLAGTLRAIVVDSGVNCGLVPGEPERPPVPEPAAVVLLAFGAWRFYSKAA